MTPTALASLYLILGMAFSKLSFNCNTKSGDFDEILYKKGDTAIACLHFLPYGVKVAFEIEVDAYVSLAMRRGYESLSKTDTDFFLQLENTENFSNLIVS